MINLFLKNPNYIVLLFAILFLTSFQKALAQEHPDCYNHLTELVRSSSFPFNNIDSKKVNILIDEDTPNLLRLKLFFDTDGTGTLGWVMYYPKERKLLNISVNLEKPIKLTFNNSFAELYEKCKGLPVLKPVTKSK